MRRNFARWALSLFGLGLALGGAAAMLRGWDIVQVERGWSLFIAGAMALSGGAVVVALAEVVARLDRLLAASADEAKATRALAPQQGQTATPAPQPQERATPAQRAAPAPPSEERAASEPHPEPWPEPRLAAVAAAPLAPPAPLRVRRQEAPPQEPLAPSIAKAFPRPSQAEEPHEVDCYQSGGLTYVIYSNGEVELRSEQGSRRFSSIEELRAVVATQE
jgi:hypothetical protein